MEKVPTDIYCNLKIPLEVPVKRSIHDHDPDKSSQFRKRKIKDAVGNFYAFQSTTVIKQIQCDPTLTPDAHGSLFVFQQ
jgi:hypothetical protein